MRPYADALRVFGPAMMRERAEPPGPVLPEPVPTPTAARAASPAAAPSVPFLPGELPRTDREAGDKDDPEMADVHMTPGRRRFTEQRKPDAQGEFSGAIACSPGRAVAWYLRGSVRYDMGRCREAAAELAESARLDPAYPGVAKAVAAAEGAARKGPERKGATK